MIRNTVDPASNPKEYRRIKRLVPDAAKFIFTSLPSKDDKIFSEDGHLHPAIKKALNEFGGVVKVKYKKHFGKWEFRNGRVGHFCYSCFLELDDGTGYAGMAYCSTKDKISKSSGKLLSLKRAVAAMLDSLA